MVNSSKIYPLKQSWYSVWGIIGTWLLVPSGNSKGFYYTLGGPDPKRVRLTHSWAEWNVIFLAFAKRLRFHSWRKAWKYDANAAKIPDQQQKLLKIDQFLKTEKIWKIEKLESLTGWLERAFVDPCFEACFGPISWRRKFNIRPCRTQIRRSFTQTDFQQSGCISPLMSRFLVSSFGLSYGFFDKEFWQISIEIQGVYPFLRNE